jgi:hypothetical protein
MVTDQPGQVTTVFPPPPLQGVRDQHGLHRPGGAPAQDPPRAGVDNESDVDHPGPEGNVGEVRDPEPVRGQPDPLPAAGAAQS